MKKPYFPMFVDLSGRHQFQEVFRTLMVVDRIILDHNFQYQHCIQHETCDW